MEEEKGMGKKGLSRRAFLGLGGTALAGAAMAGHGRLRAPVGVVTPRPMPPRAATGGVPVAESGASAGPDVAGKHSWEIAPEPIAKDKIKGTEECDVLVIGAGLARLLRLHLGA